MTGMIIESLNIGFPKKEIFYGKEVTTGICKTPVFETLTLSKLGFEGNGVADLKHHGGPDKAVCVYSMDHYSYWKDILKLKPKLELEFDLPPAAFGENLTVSNMNEDDVCIGDVFRIGTALVQISQPRQPCKTLAARYGRSDMVKMVVSSGYTGFYFRVLEEGTVKKGDSIVLVKEDHNKVTISFANHIYHHDKKNCEGVEKVLAVKTLSESWQRSFNDLKDRCRN